MKKPSHASAEDVLDLSVAVIEFYFRIEAISEALAGFATAGGEWGTLRQLVKEGPQTVPDMARSKPVSRQHCQTIVNALEGKGLVEFIDNPKHKTSKLVRVTKRGRARFESMRKQFLAAAAAYAPLFSAAEVATATDVCRRARDMMEDSRADGPNENGGRFVGRPPSRQPRRVICYFASVTRRA